MNKIKEKLPKPHLMTLIVIIVWIALWNAVALALHEQLEGTPFRSWAFFISVTFYYFLEEHDWKKRMASVFVGGSVGILFTLMLGVVASLLAGMGHVVSVMIPLCVVLVVLIIGKPFCPIAFNSVGFSYFVIATIPGIIDTIAEDTIPYIFSIGLGCIILCGGCEVLSSMVAKYYTKKAAK